MKQADVNWCGNLFKSLHDSQCWIIPRSGMIFQKQGNALVFVGTEPGVPFVGLYATMEAKATLEAALLRARLEEYRQVKRHFQIAGVTVTGWPIIDEGATNGS
jgi:hypothetical protein